MITAIVFINYFASGKQKSDRYWPSSDEEIKEGNIFIKKTSEETKRDWVLRDFLLTEVRMELVCYAQNSEEQFNTNFTGNSMLISLT